MTRPDVRLVNAWALDAGQGSHVLGGMAFESEGWSPIVWVALGLRELDPAERQLAHANGVPFDLSGSPGAHNGAPGDPLLGVADRLDALERVIGSLEPIRAATLRPRAHR